MNKISAMQSDIQTLREQLAASFRWFARLNMHEGVANHFSVATSADGREFLMNPKMIHFSRVRASDLLHLDAEDPSAMTRPDAPDPTAWFIHARIHRLLPQARCVMHLHPKYATALASLADSTMLPIDQNTMRFYNRVAVDDGYGGMALSEDEGDRLAGLLGNRSILLMGNHGVMVAAKSVAQALDDMYYFEKSAETLMTAYATGRPLRIASPQVAEDTARQWEEYEGGADAHLREVMAILDAEGAGYRG
jgi:ribulose-5-phosphate 4-epimerase/fuculose-1-phosphate aldolase